MVAAQKKSKGVRNTSKPVVSEQGMTVNRFNQGARTFSSLAKAPTKSAHSLTESKLANARSMVAAYFLNLVSLARDFSDCFFQLRSAFLAAAVFHTLSSSEPRPEMAAGAAFDDAVVAATGEALDVASDEIRREELDGCGRSASLEGFAGGVEADERWIAECVGVGDAVAAAP